MSLVESDVPGVTETGIIVPSALLAFTIGIGDGLSVESLGDVMSLGSRRPGLRGERSAECEKDDCRKGSQIANYSYCIGMHGRSPERVFWPGSGS